MSREARLRALQAGGHFHPIVQPLGPWEVLDLSGSTPPTPTLPWTLGRYDEVRGIYSQALFEGGRCVHMGLDLGGPAGVEVRAFSDGEVLQAATLQADGDYGPTLITAHRLAPDLVLYLLLGHLSAASLTHSPAGRRFRRSEVLGWLGTPEENGGWPPHVHIQLSWERPARCDLPGVVMLSEREEARRRYPDPQLITGPLYDPSADLSAP